MPSNSDSLEKFVQFLDELASIPAEEATKLYSMGKTVALEKGDYFIRAGEVPTSLAFVNSGLFRYVYIDVEGRQFTKGFMPELSILSSYSAMLRKTQSTYYIEALEPSEIVVFDYSGWLKLKETNHCWDRFLIAMLEKGYMKKESRERELLLLRAEDRYRIFLNEFPTLESRVKQHMIATYLGIIPESLSRIRKSS